MLTKLRDELSLRAPGLRQGRRHLVLNRSPVAKPDTESFVYRYSFDPGRASPFGQPGCVVQQELRTAGARSHSDEELCAGP